MSDVRDQGRSRPGGTIIVIGSALWCVGFMIIAAVGRKGLASHWWELWRYVGDELCPQGHDGSVSWHYLGPLPVSTCSNYNWSPLLLLLASAKRSNSEEVVYNSSWSPP